METFDAKRSIPDQILESILEHSDEWEITLSGTDPVIHHHKSGLEVWSYKGSNGVKIYRPSEICDIVDFTQEDKAHIYNAIEQIREERHQTIKEACKAQITTMLNDEPSSFWKSANTLFTMDTGMGGWVALILVSFLVVLNLYV